MAYNRDLQEDKPALFDAVDTVESCLNVAIPLVQGSRLKGDNIAAGLDRGFLDATTLMEFFIKRGIPQRTAHHAVGDLVRQATERNCRLADLSLKDFQAFDPSLDASIYDVLGIENAISNFQTIGSTCPEQVARQLAGWRERFQLNQ